MITKVLLLIAILIAIYLIFFKKRTEKPAKPKKPRSERAKEEVMVDCAKCGTFVSNKEAIIKNGSFYCSSECSGV